MILAIVTFTVLIITVGIVTGILERYLGNGRDEFCEIECKNYKIIYK